MAEQERLTNAERRARSREERKRKEEAARKKAAKQRMRGALVATVIAALVGFTVFQAFFTTGPTLDGERIELALADVEAARDAAGCVVRTERQPLPDSTHFDGTNEPDPAAIYTDTRPTHSGPHLGQVSAISEDGYRSQVSETATTHNLEHGAVIVWYDPDQVDRGSVSEMQTWVRTLNNSGFRENVRQGSGITTSPYEDPGIDSGQAVAFRAWGTAMDCDEFDETVANAFVAEHFGTRGIGPERLISPYPADTLEVVDADGEPVFGIPPAPEDAEVDTDEDGDGTDGDADDTDDAEPADDGTDEDA